MIDNVLFPPKTCKGNTSFLSKKSPPIDSTCERENLSLILFLPVLISPNCVGLSKRCKIWQNNFYRGSTSNNLLLSRQGAQTWSRRLQFKHRQCYFLMMWNWNILNFAALGLDDDDYLRHHHPYFLFQNWMESSWDRNHYDCANLSPSKKWWWWCGTVTF